MEQFLGDFTTVRGSDARVNFKHEIYHYNYEIWHKYRLAMKIWTICGLKKVVKSANSVIWLLIKFALNWQSETPCVGARGKDMLPKTRVEDTGRVPRTYQTHSLTLPPARTVSYLKAFIPNTTNHWNEMPPGLRKISAKSQFKKHFFTGQGTETAHLFLCHGMETGKFSSYQTEIKIIEFKFPFVFAGKIREPQMLLWKPTWGRATFPHRVSHLQLGQINSLQKKLPPYPA